MNRKAPRRLPGRREDGAATKMQILEAAGAVFAEKGFDRATGKEIAERAGTNSAAVNYYYGGIGNLYGEVLVAAHARLVAYDSLAALAHRDGDPREKLRDFIALIVHSIANPTSSSWALRVLSREILAPSPLFMVLRERELLPKKQLFTELIGTILELPPDHPVVARCCVSILGPFMMILIGGRQILERMFPEVRLDQSPEATIDHLTRFSFGGIDATIAALRQDGLRQARNG